ncbi:MAG: hypothetical protein CMD07_04535 [Flavobacteriales bacterium]|nr:hypothetical protein [Flavobacteriales bacterium]
MTKLVYFLLTILLIFNSCVSIEKYKELDTNLADFTKENDKIKKINQDLEILNIELNDNLIRISSRTKKLENDTLTLGRELRKKEKLYDNLNLSYELLIKNNSNTMANQSRENKELIEKLSQMEISLNEREQDIKEREDELYELRKNLENKDRTLSELKSKISDALLSYKGEGLNVEVRNSKLYISLENSLLFSSGSWKINSNGKKALIKLSNILAQQSTINITVEGHTDSIPYNGSGIIKDNWDLSVLRATSIVRVILNNKGIKPERIEASGRSSFNPLVKNDSKENRARNRRTEIILSPNIDILLKLLD